MSGGSKGEQGKIGNNNFRDQEEPTDAAATLQAPADGGEVDKAAPRRPPRRAGHDPKTGHKNRFASRSKLSERTFRQIVTLFALNHDATAIARAVGLSRNTVNSYLKKIRMRMAERCLVNSPLFLKRDSAACFFLAARKRRARPDLPVLFGLVNDRGQVYVDPFPLGESAVLQALTRGQLLLDFSLRDEGWRVHRMVCDLDLIDPDADLPVNGGEHRSMGRATRFLAYLRHRITVLRGLKAETFKLHLKECEFRFNTPPAKLADALIDLFRRNPLREVECAAEPSPTKKDARK